MFCAAGLRRLHTFEVKHIRAIARSPVHLTRESTVQLYQRLRLLSPGDHLQKLTKSRIKALSQLQDPALTQFQQRHEELQQHMLAMKHGLQEVTVPQALPVLLVVSTLLPWRVCDHITQRYTAGAYNRFLQGRLNVCTGFEFKNTAETTCRFANIELAPVSHSYSYQLCSVAFGPPGCEACFAVRCGASI